MTLRRRIGLRGQRDAHLPTHTDTRELQLLVRRRPRPDMGWQNGRDRNPCTSRSLNKLSTGKCLSHRECLLL